MPPVKRPMNSFVAFTTERVRKAKEASPSTFSFGNVLNECSAAWKTFSDAEKKVSFLLYYGIVSNLLKSVIFYPKGICSYTGGACRI